MEHKRPNEAPLSQWEEFEAGGVLWDILDHAPDALFVYDACTERIVAANRSAWESLGYDRDELIGKTPRDFDTNVMQDETFLLRKSERVLGGDTFSFETRHRRKDGAEFPVEVRVALFEHGDRPFVLAQVRDIADRKAAEHEHRVHLWYLESIERVNRALQGANDLEQMVNDVLDVVLDVFECDRTLLGTYAGEPELTSLTVAARRNRPGFESPVKIGFEYPIDEDFRPLLQGLKAAAEPRQHSLESKPPLPRSLTARTGLQAMLSMSLHPKLEERDYFFMLGQCSRPKTWTADEIRLFREIGLRLGDAMVILSMLGVLRQSEARLEEAEHIAHVGWWERDLLTNRVYLSGEVRRMFCLTKDDMQHWGQQHWFELIHPEDRPRALQATTAALRGAARYDIEYRLMRPDGAMRVVHSRGEVKWDDTRRPVRLFGTLQDVTEVRRVEEELRASESRFRTFVDHATDGFFLYDKQLTIVDVNQHACDSLGYRREELIGMRPPDFDVGLARASVVQIAERLGAGETVTFETLHRRKDGTQFPVEVRIRSLQVGERMLHLSLVRDITERKRAEERLREQDRALETTRTELARVSRVTTLGELTTSIAHEVAQPLGGMIASAAAGSHWLAAKPPNIVEARSALDNIAADGERAREVMARIRALTKRQMPRKERLDINHETLEVLALTERELRRHDIVLRTQLDRMLPHVAGDRVQLQQVLINLIMNAIEAMSGVRERPRELTIATGPDGAGAVRVEVRDSGTGLDPKGAERVFEAFYTTKVEGIGIGLSISRSIVEAHGGRLSASPNEPHGAVFRFSLPVAKDSLS